MRALTKQEVKNVIEGKRTVERIPNLYSIWIYPDVFEEKEQEMQEWHDNQVCDVDEFFLNMPDMVKGTEADPEYCWLPAGKYEMQEGSRDNKSYIADWEDEEAVEEFFEKFPSAEYPNLVPEKKLDHSKYILGRWWYCFFERHWSLRGMENALTDFYLYPDEVHRLYQKLADMYMRFLERMKAEGGADGVFVSDDIGTQTGAFFSKEIFREFFKPYYKQLIDKAHELGMHFWLHTCGNIESFLEDFIEIGLDVIHPIQKYTMDEKEIAQKYGGRICFLAGFDVQQIIPFGTPDEVRAEVDYLINTFRREDGRLMLTMGNGATRDWKRESLDALFEETALKGGEDYMK